MFLDKQNMRFVVICWKWSLGHRKRTCPHSGVSIIAFFFFFFIFFFSFRSSFFYISIAFFFHSNLFLVSIAFFSNLNLFHIFIAFSFHPIHFYIAIASFFHSNLFCIAVNFFFFIFFRSNLLCINTTFFFHSNLFNMQIHLHCFFWAIDSIRQRCSDRRTWRNIWNPVGIIKPIIAPCPQRNIGFYQLFILDPTLLAAVPIDAHNSAVSIAISEQIMIIFRRCI
mmetsp:Transcript_12883/g.22147  ORF Transcript_12883/g.22147 Transcript_12883/m.22147 type:complete len:224 (+) Transcript_12883:1189-1860(+)